ncbi:hypothetical protein [Paenibacillus donghaensis]|uniref:Uncharacterized protein n=1 Tax=Paenibacillus donghaensis TaxID=414771 RepID=A0A2Z2KTP7_9BACL|nr:hypothetical protein [Paenibacillus donghaensis]ASA25262.1 hypothetical protein B9T62_33740 [Paenibacillus donghaensis]
MNKLKPLTLLLSLLLALISLPETSAASAVELTPAVQAAFDLTAATAVPTVRARLNEAYAELAALKGQYDDREEQIRKLHYSNQQELIVVRKQIKGIDLAKVSRLETVYATAKQKYQPLFDQYSALNRRIRLVKGLKDKTLNAVLRSQADAMKLLVQLAREDISGKLSQLKAAKDARSKKVTAVRQTLAGMESPQISIKSHKSTVTALNKRVSADWSDFKAAIRKQNTVLTSQSLSSLVSGYRQIAASKQKIIELEQKVAGVISSAKKQAEA